MQPERALSYLVLEPTGPLNTLSPLYLREHGCVKPEKPSRPTSRWVRMLSPFALVVGSTGLALLVAEGALRTFDPQIFPRTPAGLFTERPDGFRVLSPGFSGTISRAEFDAPVRIGSFGVRGEGPGPRTDSTFRILTLGDSQTFGFGVLDDQTYSVHLERILGTRFPSLDVEVVNAGVPGYGTVDEVIWLRERAHEVDPDLIVSQFLSVNDFKINRASPFTAELLGDADDGAMESSGGSRSNGARSLASRIVEGIHAAKNRSHAATLITEGLSYIAMRMGLLGGVAAMWGEDFTPEDAEKTRALLVLLAREAQALDVPIVLVYTTGKAQVIAGDGSGLPSKAVVSGAASDAGVPWIDMTDALRSRSDRQELYFMRDGHWTATGHRAVAEVLADRLGEMGLMR